MRKGVLVAYKCLEGLLGVGRRRTSHAGFAVIMRAFKVNALAASIVVAGYTSFLLIRVFFTDL